MLFNSLLKITFISLSVLRILIVLLCETVILLLFFVNLFAAMIFDLIHMITYFFAYIPFREVYCFFKPKLRPAFCASLREYRAA